MVEIINEEVNMKKAEINITFERPLKNDFHIVFIPTIGIRRWKREQKTEYTILIAWLFWAINIEIIKDNL